MKSEMAEKYIDNDTITMRNGDRMVDASTAYIAIELAERETEERIRTELTRWHSECELPECGKSVLIKCKSGSTGEVFYVVGYHSGYEWCDEGVLITHYDSVIGWREIYEL